MLHDLSQALAEATPAQVKVKITRPKIHHPMLSSFKPIHEVLCDTSGVGSPILDMIGIVNYLANRSRPDIKYICSVLCTKDALAPPSFVDALSHLERYLVLTKEITLQLGGSDKEIELFGYADASFNKSETGVLSYLGYCLFLSKDSGAISSASSKIKRVCTSSTDAEIRALREVVREVIWLRGFLAELGFKQLKPTTIFQDSKPTIELCTNERSVNMSKHIIPLLAVIREAINDQVINLVYCPTEWMVADILTSADSKGESYQRSRDILMRGHKFTFDTIKSQKINLAPTPFARLFNG